MPLPSQPKNLMTLKLISVFFLLFLTGFVFLPAVQSAAAEELTVSAAISLKNAFEDIGRQFEKSHPGIKVLFNFGASGDLARQIEAGAPVDVFASAALKDMDDLDRQGLIRPGSKTNFAGNTLVLIVPNRSTIPVKSFQDLKDRPHPKNSHRKSQNRSGRKICPGGVDQTSALGDPEKQINPGRKC